MPPNVHKARLPYVNLGCGRCFHPDWINLDLVSMDPAVTACDLSRGIPLPDGSCAVVYHSHVLEHLRRQEAPFFLQECARVLKPGGIIRVAVPDLEAICRLYLEKLARAEAGDVRAEADHHWLVLEMYDQAVRENWRSPMRDFFEQSPLPNPDFVRARVGDEVLALAGPAVPPTPAQKLRHWLANRSWLRTWRIGRFRQGGEVHQWMYDRLSLRKLLEAAGFQKVVVRQAEESSVPDWAEFHLDVQPDGRVRKPDSLFMEGVKI